MLRYPGCTAEIALHARALRLACHGPYEGGLASLHVSATDLNAVVIAGKDLHIRSASTSCWGAAVERAAALHR
jgi:hypothetical protein